MTIDAADVVLHHPTGEKWVVAVVYNGDLCWVGWPEGIAKVSDCELVEKATPEKRFEMLKLWAEKTNDVRASYARAVLDEEAQAQQPSESA